jgi:hypothetical protein
LAQENEFSARAATNLAQEIELSFTTIVPADHTGVQYSPYNKHEASKSDEGILVAGLAEFQRIW